LPLPITTTTTDEAARKTTASPEVSVGLPPPVADNDDAIANANADLVGDTQPTDGSIGATGGLWTLEEDAKLTSAFTNNRKKKHGKELKTDWVAIAALVPDRTKVQCLGRWKNALNACSDETTGCTGAWTEDEDNKLKDALPIHGGKDWVAIAALVPGRTKKQCTSRWHNACS
jgi:hypothetical protein